MTFLGYVGGPDFHDGLVRDVQRDGDRVDVVIEGYTGRRFKAEFHGVESVEGVQPVGMTLYALSEVSDTLPLRKFVFVNSFEGEDDPRGEAKLEIRAREVIIRGEWAEETASVQ